MQDVSARYLDAIRHSHAKVASAVHHNLVDDTDTTLAPKDGTVTVDVTSNVRRTLSLNVPTSEVTWDALDTEGGEITLTRSVRFTNGELEPVPLGVFIVDVDEIGYGPGDTITITAPDRWGKVQKNTLPPSGRASVPSNAAWQEIQRLVEGAWSMAYPFPGWSLLDESATTKVGALLWDDGNREAAILGLCTDNSLEVFFDASGLGVLRPIPVLDDDSIPVWTVDAGTAGVMISADRSRDRTRVSNAIIVSTAATDVTFPPQEVKDTTSGDPLAVAGPLGYMATEYSSPSLRNSAQARAAGRTMLARTLGVAKQLSLESVQNDALDARDVISVILPKIDRNTERPTELHIIDTITIPLAPSGTQQIATRSTRPSTDGS